MDIASIFVQAAERYPDHTALIFEDRRWTYREWHARVRRFAQGLADLGVRPSDRVDQCVAPCGGGRRVHVMMRASRAGVRTVGFEPR